MTADEALNLVESLLAEQNQRLNQNERFNDIERIVFKGAWIGETYEQIHPKCGGRSLEHIERNVGPKLWQKISQVLNEPVSKPNLRGPIDRARQKMYSNEVTVEENSTEQRNESDARPEDWYRVVPDVPLFVGRKPDLDRLAQEIRLHGCRLLTLYGLGGVGKTALAAKLGDAVWDQFDVRIWRSIAHRPSLSALQADLQKFLGGSANDLLFDQLRDRRCLIVLDGYESLLQGGVHDGAYQNGYGDYGRWLEQLGRTMHQSCIILTSREEPKESAILAEKMSAAVQSFPVRGIGAQSVRRLFQLKGGFEGNEGDWNLLTRRCDGNLDALNEVATSIRVWCDGNVGGFLEQSQGEVLLGEARSRLEEQFARLSLLEQQVVSYLLQNEGATVSDIRSANRSLSMAQLDAVLKSLRRRSMLERDETRYGLTRLLRRYLQDGNDAV